MNRPDPSFAQRQFLWTVQGIDGNWSTKAGGDTTAATSDAYNGGDPVPEKLGSNPVTGNITLTRPYKASLRAVEDRLTPQVGEWTTTIVGYDRDRAGIPVGKPRVYNDALLVRLKGVDYDESSGEPTNFEAEFAVPEAG